MSLKFYLLSHVYSPSLHVVCLSCLTDSFYSLKLRYKRETQKNSAGEKMLHRWVYKWDAMYSWLVYFAIFTPSSLLTLQQFSAFYYYISCSYDFLERMLFLSLSIKIYPIHLIGLVNIAWQVTLNFLVFVGL